MQQNFWVKEHRQIYLIGNPVIWWLSSLAISACLIFRGILVLRNQRGYRDLRNREPRPWLRVDLVADQAWP